VIDAMNEVRQEQYATVIREMIRHENEVTNHGIIWLLIGQGFLANAFVSGPVAGKDEERTEGRARASRTDDDRDLDE
jgi:hypothetical protein